MNTRLHSSYFVRSSKNNHWQTTPKFWNFILPPFFPQFRMIIFRKAWKPFYLQCKNPFTFYGGAFKNSILRGASKNSTMTGSPLPSSSVITAHKHATRREAMTKDSCRPMILKPCQRPVHGSTKRKRRTGRNRQEFWRLLKHWQFYQRRWPPLLSCCGWPHIMFTPPLWHVSQHHQEDKIPNLQSRA